MSDEPQNTPNTPEGSSGEEPKGTPTPPKSDSNTGDEPKGESYTKADVDRMIQEALGELKENLKKVEDAKKDALTRVHELEQKERDAEIARLKEEGKHKEAYEAELADLRAKNEALEKMNTELTRNSEVSSKLNSYEFRTEKARNMAMQEITDALVKNEQGIWVHKSGQSIDEFIEAFAKDESNSFLFKQKQSQGSGTSHPGTATPASTPTSKSLFEMSQAEVLEMARKGQL
jgi:hypothetical protein